MSPETHILNEEVFGTVAFIGLSRANTWDIMGLLDCKLLRVPVPDALRQ